MQTTVAGCVRLKGIGLHSGRECRMNICPAEAGHGVIFRLVGGVDGFVEIPRAARFHCIDSLPDRAGQYRRGTSFDRGAHHGRVRGAGDR